MLEFKILKKSKKSRARLGALKTPHGEIETPAFVPVATQAAIKALTSEETLTTKSQLLIANTFYLHLRPGEKIVKKAGGLHKFMNWPKPLMTDSGGFQVFSLGFGKDFNTGKILREKSEKKVGLDNQPKSIKITDQGVVFSSPIDGQKIFLGPKESIKIQETLGADIIYAFDECPPPVADYAYLKKSLERTHSWARSCLKTKKSNQSLYGIVQGGRFKDLRVESARFIASLDFDGFGIGGEFGVDKRVMSKMLKITLAELPEEKPRHLLGIGHLDDISRIAEAGIDTFDCTLPTHYGRHGIAFTSQGPLDMVKSKFLNDLKPLDKKCDCSVCRNYSRGYISHLFRAKEITALTLLTFHNLYFFNSFVEKIRQAIKKGAI